MLNKEEMLLPITETKLFAPTATSFTGTSTLFVELSTKLQSAAV